MQTKSVIVPSSRADIAPNIEYVETFIFGKHRERNLRKTLNKALELLHYKLASEL